MTTAIATLRDAYRILGVGPRDDAATVRRAWLRLVRAYHPDMVRGDTGAANQRLAEINAAYDLVEANTQASGAEQASAAEAARQAEQARKAEAARWARAQAARRAEDARRAQEARRQEEAELARLRTKRAKDAARADLAYASRSARRATWSESDKVAARAAQIAFIAARRAYSDEQRLVRDTSVIA
ncbi:hypothetical protein AIOL_002037 [Candidatus Rhodobacter oscarellae]|uniref:J domain-containing protein n=1 Tax=Candidatus Rhodobacter oscarellae TaxID=1675527 RepID=A0A0J9E5I3_9RHOB|nr:J domain-containing protein [Candidatus Rhodobacter lobularis]KMW57079.1 hypothetical protein AIOL_002037 [Candidatus Rhodobacter lobularis]